MTEHEDMHSLEFYKSDLLAFVQKLMGDKGLKPWQINLVAEFEAKAKLCPACEGSRTRPNGMPCEQCEGTGERL
jgi:hypothetical protein